MSMASTERARDAMTVIGQSEAKPETTPPARLVVRGLVISASLRSDNGTILRASVSGAKGSAWMDLRWDREPHEHDHAELATEIVESIVLVMREVPIALTDIDFDENAARAFLYSCAYLAIASWQPACSVGSARTRGFRRAAPARRGLG
jgi:hypothetical protein